MRLTCRMACRTCTSLADVLVICMQSPSYIFFLSIVKCRCHPLWANMTRDGKHPHECLKLVSCDCTGLDEAWGQAITMQMFHFLLLVSGAIINHEIPERLCLQHVVQRMCVTIASCRSNVSHNDLVSTSDLRHLQQYDLVAETIAFAV